MRCQLPCCEVRDILHPQRLGLMPARSASLLASVMSLASPAPCPKRYLSGTYLHWFRFSGYSLASALRWGFREKPSHSWALCLEGARDPTRKSIAVFMGAQKPPDQAGSACVWSSTGWTGRLSNCFILKIILSNQSTFFSLLLTTKEVERMTNKGT